MDFMQEFHANGKLVKGINPSFIVLIPKVENPVKLKDYRPISLIGSLYKILAKVLANRLKSIMDGLICENQSAFVGKRQITGGVLALNEVVDEMKRKRLESFILKVDFEKAYDCVNWDFLNCIMEKYGFGGVHYLLEEAVKVGQLEGVVKGILRWFELMLGLKINFNKSSIIGVKIDEMWMKRAAEFLKCKRGSIPFMYLGMLVGDNPRRRKMWMPVVERFQKRLSGWKLSSLSYGGRLILLKSILSSLPLYYFFVFKLPMCVLQTLKKLEWDFLWGIGMDARRKIHWVSWDKVCLGKDKGGLGAHNLRIRNLTLLGKWWARFEDEEGGLWKKVVMEKYYRGRDAIGVESVRKRRLSKVWGDIVSIGRDVEVSKEVIRDGFLWKLGEGNSIRFWMDRWLEGHALEEIYLRLKYVSSKKESRVQEMGEWKEGQWHWKFNWKRTLLGRELEEEKELLGLIEGMRIQAGQQDKRMWTFDGTGVYTSKKAYSLLTLDQWILDAILCKAIWNNFLVGKMSFFFSEIVFGQVAYKEEFEFKRH
ncbi:hypothetical protein SLEP1_g40985 [Rubroshorea leprosula]|nr:hypothetical protein SLEP1_g40985 [Rubroshorea leprosula]